MGATIQPAGGLPSPARRYPLSMRAIKWYSGKISFSDKQGVILLIYNVIFKIDLSLPHAGRKACAAAISKGINGRKI